MAKRSMSETKKDEQFCHEEEEEEEEITEEEEEEELEGEVSRKRILIRFSGESTRSVSSQTTPCCQVDGCDVDLRTAKIYHRRHKVCERHAKEAVVSVCGVDQRYCQQCSRFHKISEFDDTKRSCRMRLAGHNERRRKNHPDIQAEEDESWEPAVPP